MKRKNTKLSRRHFLYIMKKQNMSASGVDFKAELRGIKTELKKLDPLAHINESVSVMSEQIDEVIKAVAKNEEKLGMMQKKKSKMLKAKIIR